MAVEDEAATTSINTLRRFYLLKRLRARTLDERGLEGVWRQKQEAEAGTELADAFPAREALVAAGYSTEEDLNGADVDELVSAGLTYHDATAALAALE